METNRPEIDALFSVTYEQLRRLAAHVSGADVGATLNPTSLVNEAYVKLSESLFVTPASQLHFKRIAARAMRQVIVEAIRRRNAVKRGGGCLVVTFDEDLALINRDDSDVLELDEALEAFARQYPRQAQMVEYRFFGGYGVSETAQLLGVSEATVTRDWRVARAWLAAALGRGNQVQ